MTAKAKKILYATDFSPASAGALELAASLARDWNATLVIVHVAPPVPFGGGEAFYPSPVAEEETLQAALMAVVPEDANVDYEHRLLVGDAATEIVGLAEDEGMDLIVMGTHGRTGLSRLVMGSVAEAVVRRAPCPVLTHKLPKHVVASAERCGRQP